MDRCNCEGDCRSSLSLHALLEMTRLTPYPGQRANILADAVRRAISLQQLRCEASDLGRPHARARTPLLPPLPATLAGYAIECLKVS